MNSLNGLLALNRLRFFDMNVRKKKNIGGIDYVQCKICGDWFPYKRGQSKCAYCHAAYIREYAKKHPNKIKKIVKKSEQKRKRDRKHEFSVEPTPEQFEESSKINGLFTGVESEELKQAMVDGDYNRFMELTE